VTAAVRKRVLEEIVHPTLRGLREEGSPFVGVLYCGLMIDAEGAPRVVEFNVRFGDPETQALVLQMDGDLVPFLDGAARGRLDSGELASEEGAAVCVVLASGGYPRSYETGKPIEGLAEAEALGDVLVFHAGTARAAEGLVTAGGRVLGVTARAPGLRAARELAYAAAARIRFAGCRAGVGVTAPAAAAPGLDAALDWLVGDGLLAYPTETVWGLGAAAASERAVERLRAWKGRGDAAPIAVLVPDLGALEALGAELSDAARTLAAAFWPGPLTLVLRCPARFAPGIAGREGAVGFRCSSHPAARALARAAFARGLGALTATSLNRSGETPARTRGEAAALCREDGPRLLAGSWPDAEGGAPSSVIDLSGAAPRLLREGAIEAGALLRRAREGGPR
jgi:tRNA threonylcarbamoyl adenosine modification protein (Sua5/YciO/YrdC/YwlC family)